MASERQTLEQLTTGEYKYGFVSDIDADQAPKGLSEDISRLISAKKNEPSFMLEWRLKAYYSAPKPKKGLVRSQGGDVEEAVGPSFDPICPGKKVKR